MLLKIEGEKMLGIVRKRLSKLLAIVMIALMSFVALIPFDAVDVEASSNIIRISGSDRYDTSCKAAYYLQKLNGGKKFDAIILSTGSNYPDALGGSYLCKVTGAPLILVNNKTIPRAMECVSKVMNKNGTIYMLGGAGAVSRRIENAFMQAGYQNIERIEGKSRYETNLELLKAADAFDKEKNENINRNLIICSGANFADALSAGSTGHPIMVVGNKLSSDQLAYIKERSYNRFFIMGGVKAVSKSIENALKGRGTVIRLEGGNRFDTSLKAVNKFFPVGKTKEAIVVSGENFPDGLSATPIAQKLGSPILLISNTHIAESYNYLKKNKVGKAIVFGGQNIIQDKTVGVSGTGLTAGWNNIHNHLVYIHSDGTIATKAFSDGYNTIVPSTGGFIAPEQRQRFIWPVEGPLTSYFGYRDDVPSWASSDHGGIDIGVGYYTPVKASASGTVIWPTGWYQGYGNLVVIQHADGYVTYYGHNSYNLVSVGDRVFQGQIVASSGSTGNSTGPHVHFEIRRYGVKRDPLDYLPRNRYW